MKIESNNFVAACESNTLQSEWEQLSQPQKKKKGKEQKEGREEDCCPQTAREKAGLKDNTSVNRSYITSYHSPNFTPSTGD